MSLYYAFLLALSKPLPLTFRFRKHPPTTATTKPPAEAEAEVTASSSDEEKSATPDSQPADRHPKCTMVRRLKDQLRTDPSLRAAHVRPVAYDAPQHNIYQARVPTRRRSSDNHNHLDDAVFAVDKASLPSKCPALKEFLNCYSDTGYIARQEFGSMLPVFLLHQLQAFPTLYRHRVLVGKRRSVSLRVLDMCASPGSKTMQIAEELVLVTANRAGATTRTTASSSSVQEEVMRIRGRVRANDINDKRLDALKAAVKRSRYDFGGANGDDDDAVADDENTQGIIHYTNFDASQFQIPSSEHKKYDIILCDVPCSGDGTVRKAPRELKIWSPDIGNQLHRTQKRILLRALQCIALDGYVVYSTCTFNPIENEAVVHGALTEIAKQQKKRKGNTTATMKFEVVEVPRQLLNGLILHPGVATWKVADVQYTNNGSDAAADDGIAGYHDEEEERLSELLWYDTYESATTMKGIAVRSMWPPSPSISPSTNSRKAASDESAVPLQHCLRLLPQDQDTGGFFVTIIRRIQ